MSSRRQSIIPQAIFYYEFDECTDTKSNSPKGPINYDVFEKRYRSHDYPDVNYKTTIWNGTELKKWTPIFSIDYLFKRLDPKKYYQLKLKHKQQNKSKRKEKEKEKEVNEKAQDTQLLQYIFSMFKYSHRSSNVCTISLELLKWCFISRSAIFCISFVVHLCVAPFDSSAAITSSHSSLFISWMEPLSHWDGSHFLNIAQFGYQHEKMYAFYPGFPLIINSIILFVKPVFFNKWKFKSMALFCGIAWNAFIASYLSALILYYLTIKIYKKPSIALISAKLFLINPASVFFVSIYTEATFAFCSFLLMLCCELKYFDFNTYILNSHNIMLTFAILLCLIIASSLRSNGILIVGFPLFYHIYCNWFLSNNISNIFAWLKISKISAIKPSSISSISRFILLILLSFLGLSPWFYFQYFCKKSLCLNHWIAADRIYCANISSTVYSFVQSNYWNCGLLKRWNLNEIGNFILAAPIWCISFYAMRYYINQLHLHLIQSKLQNDEANVILHHKLIPYIIYWFLLWMICILYAHVQISTRFICCSSPLLYWFCAQIIENDNNEKYKDKSKERNFIDIISQNPPKLIISYFLLYFILGSVAFCAYLPFV